MSTPYDIGQLTVLTTALENITTANGYNTDVETVTAEFGAEPPAQGMPWVRIDWDIEPETYDDVAPNREMKARRRVDIVGVVEASTLAERRDYVSRLKDDIIAAVFTDHTLALNCIAVRLLRSVCDVSYKDEQGSKPKHAACRLSFEIYYRRPRTLTTGGVVPTVSYAQVAQTYATGAQLTGITAGTYYPLTTASDATMASSLLIGVGFSLSSGGRLTYTGAAQTVFRIRAMVGLSGAAAAGLFARIYVNGSAVAEPTGVELGDFAQVAVERIVTLSNNDYVEIWATVGSGTEINWSNLTLIVTRI